MQPTRSNIVQRMQDILSIVDTAPYVSDVEAWHAGSSPQDGLHTNDAVDFTGRDPESDRVRDDAIAPSQSLGVPPEGMRSRQAEEESDDSDEEEHWDSEDVLGLGSGEGDIDDGGSGGEDEDPESGRLGLGPRDRAARGMLLLTRMLGGGSPDDVLGEALTAHGAGSEAAPRGGGRGGDGGGGAGSGAGLGGAGAV